MGLYANENEVKLRLKGKVQFTDDDTDENRMHVNLLRRLISEAEGEVELDLSPRYMAPFQTDAGLAFSQLPERPTREIIRTLAELKSVIRVLETDFGSGSVMDGSKYSDSLQKRYDKLTERLLKRREYGGNETTQFLYPPLPNLMLNYQNEQGDDGFMGQILVTSDGHGDYGSAQINSPGETFWNGSVDEIDREPDV